MDGEHPHHHNNWNFGYHVDSPSDLLPSHDFDNSVRSPELDMNSLHALWNTEPSNPHSLYPGMMGGAVATPSFQDLSLQGHLYQGQQAMTHQDHLPSNLMNHAYLETVYPSQIYHSASSPQGFPYLGAHHSNLLQPTHSQMSQMLPGSSHQAPVMIPDDDDNTLSPTETLQSSRKDSKEDYLPIYNEWAWQRKLPNDINKAILLTVSSKWPEVTQPNLLDAIYRVGQILDRRRPLIELILKHDIRAIKEVGDASAPPPPRHGEIGELLSVNRYIQQLEFPLANQKARNKVNKYEKRPKWTPKSVATPAATMFKKRIMRGTQLTAVRLGKIMNQLSEDDREAFIRRVLQGDDSQINETAEEFSHQASSKEASNVDQDEQHNHVESHESDHQYDHTAMDHSFPDDLPSPWN